MFCHLLSALGNIFYDFLHPLENVQSLCLGSGMNVVTGNHNATYYQAASKEIAMSCTENTEEHQVISYRILCTLISQNVFKIMKGTKLLKTAL